MVILTLFNFVSSSLSYKKNVCFTVVGHVINGFLREKINEASV